MVIPRRVSQGGLVLKGLFIPEETAIGDSAVDLNRNPKVLLRPNAHELLSALLHIGRSISSNQLAYYLLAQGCEVGDVVIIYANRGSVPSRFSLS